jgi:hypothetical protein
LNKEEKQTLVKYRLERANESMAQKAGGSVGDYQDKKQ